MVEKNLDLIFEFETYVAGHPRFADKIPEEAINAFQVAGDAAFNRRSRRIGEKQPKHGRRPMVHVTISKTGVGPFPDRDTENRTHGKNGFSSGTLDMWPRDAESD
ncbi:MAG: hypothetical protein HY748_08230 [Elusimicrobia bacterium]|nr:hypothetical protein [Elusimicrobiota bacterium]